MTPKYRGVSLCFAQMAAQCSPSFPPPGLEYETLKQLEDRLIGDLQSEDLLTLTRKAAEQGLIGSDVNANIESMDSSVPSSLVCRYLFYSVYAKIFDESGEVLEPAEHEKWWNLLSRSNSAVRFLARYRQPWGGQSTDFGEQDVPLLTEALAECSSKWREIGISLGLLNNEVQNIAMIHMNMPILCLNAVLTSWVMSKFPYTKPPMLKSLEKALGSQIVGLGREASTLRDRVEKIIAANTREVCLFLEQFDSTTKDSKENSEAFGIIDQTPKATSAEGKSVLLEVRVRAPFVANLTSKWYCDGEHLRDGSVMSSFEGVHIFMKCISVRDLTAEGTYICKVFQKTKKGSFLFYKESEQILLTLTTPIDVPCEILTNYYTLRPVPKDTWAPIVGNTYISLALIKQEGIHHAGKYGRCTIRGDMDDIYADKESTDFEKAFHNLSRGMRVLVEGRPGSGKTTLVHKVSQDWANGCLKMKYVRLVFLVPLRALPATPNINLSTILNCFYSSGSAMSDDILKYAEKHNGLGLCFILDGLDEYSPNSTCDNYIFSLIRKQILPNALVIVASRPAAAAKFRYIANIQVEVLGFLKEQIRDYIENYKFSAGSKCASLHKYLDQHPNVHHMCYLPIHVEMVCFLFDREAQLPNSTETGIYKAFTTFSILRSSHDPYLPSLEDLPSPQRNTFRTICKLAYKMTVSSKQVMQQTEFQALNIKSEADLLGLVTVDELAMRCGFEKMYTFLHLTFQEFLGAFYVSHLPKVQQMELLEQYGKAEHMQQVWKFYCGLTKLELGEAFDILFGESSHHSTVYMIQCIFESQNQCLCNFAVKNETLAFLHSYLNHGDFVAAAYVLLNATVRELSFDGCVFGSEDVATLVEKAGSSFSQILTLTFCDHNSSAEQIKIADILDHLFDLSSTDLSSNAVLALTENLSHPTLQVLKVGSRGSVLYVSEQFQVANILAHSLPSLVLFDLGSTNLSPNVLSALTENMSHPTLQVLKVGSRGNDLYKSLNLPLDLACTLKAKCKSFRNICFSGSNGVCLPADAQWPLPFCFCCNHPKLVLSCHPLCAMEVKALSHDLKAHFYSNLSLINCNIGDEEIFYLAQGLSCCSSLEVLELSCNRIGDTGAMYLAKSIKLCLKLGKLDLSCNRIGDMGALAVANSVKSNVKVYFCLNCITEFVGSTNLNTIELSSKGLLDSDLSLLTTALLSFNCDELQQFCLQGNSISCNGMTPLSTVLKRSSNLLVLNLSSNNIGGKGAMVLAGALSHCTNLLKLDVSSNYLRSDGAKAIARVLTGCTKMLELNISFNSIGCDGTEAIAQALHHCPVLQELDISSNNFGVKGAKSLADAIQCCRSVLSLHANSNDICDEGAIVLAEGLKCCWNLQELKIHGNCIGSEGAHAIANALEHCPFVRTLDIGFNNIDLEEIQSNLCSELPDLAFHYNRTTGGKICFRNGFQKLTTLNIANIQLNSGGAWSLASFMNGCLNIREFRVYENSIGDDGAQAIAGILSKCDSLQLLDVAQNGITECGAIALASALRGKQLCELDFSRNCIGSQGALALAEVLNSATIKRLKIEDCALGPEGTIYLAQSLKYCSSLIELNISGNNIESRGAIAIAGCVSQCSNLRSFHVNENHIGPDGCQVLSEVLNKCSDLHVLDISRTAILKQNSLVDFFKKCVHLQKLNVSCCFIRPDFISGLKFCVDLEKIDISQYSLSEKLVADFCFLLRNCRLLNELFINHTCISLDSAKILSDSLYYCKNLEVLDVGYTFTGNFSSGSEFACCLCSKFTHNVKIHSLNIEANFLGTAGVIALVDSLKHCTKLQEFNMGSNKIMDEGAIALAGALKYWPDLRVLRVGCRGVHYQTALGYMVLSLFLML